MPDVKKFLDGAGTGHLWTKIKIELDKKADASDLSSLQSYINNLDIPAAYDDTVLAGRVTATEGIINTLVGSDTSKSIRTIANEELVTQLIPANAAEARDTLAEIAAWIQSHPDDAAAMNATISMLQNKLELGTHTVITYSQAGENAKYSEGTIYYTDSTGSTEINTSSFVDGVTDVSEYYIATVTTPQYATVKAYVEAMMAQSGHTHSNQAILDTITSAMITAWNTALQPNDVIALDNNEIDAAIAAANQSQQSGD